MFDETNFRGGDKFYFYWRRLEGLGELKGPKKRQILLAEISTLCLEE